MKLMTYVDSEGYTRRVKVRDKDNDPTIGIPMEIPNLDEIDFNALKRELHNELMRRELYTWRDVQEKKNEVTASIITVLKRKIINLYKIGG